jgi:hypothetical protein
LKLKSIIQGFGIASSLLLLRLWQYFSHYHLLVYHSFLPMRTMTLGMLLELVISTLLAALLIGYLDRRPGGWRGAVWALIAAELISIAITDASAMHRAPSRYLNPAWAFTVVLLSGLLLRWFSSAAYQKAVQALGVLLLFAGCSMVWMLPQLLYQVMRSQPHDTLAGYHEPALVPGFPAPAVGKRRIVWLLFDELSYDQAFEHRAAGLALPTFDQFRVKSINFSQVQPIGTWTDRVVPALLLGQPVGDIHSDLDGRLTVQTPGNWKGVVFDSKATIFADAQRLGWTTGVVGWFNPYCRILAGTLNWCFWRMDDGQTDGLPQRSAVQNTLTPLLEAVREWRQKPTLMEQGHAQDLADLMPQAKALLLDERIRLVFIHLPIPHQPGIYHRNPNQRSSMGSYIDNLALADKVLAELLNILRQTSLAPNTTVIVSSDHSWRTPMWRATPFWTKEDQEVSGGRFDPRPVLMIHLSGQQAGREVSGRFDGLRLHEVLDDMVRGDETAFANVVSLGNRTRDATQAIICPESGCN